MSFKHCAILTIIFLGTVDSQDTFNYRETEGRDWGPTQWNRVTCNNLKTCPGWPEKMLGSVGWTLNRNECRHCPIEGNRCGQHRQSPIDLHRDRAIAGHPNEKECPDWHWIMYKAGSCQWEDMVDQFEISRHALQIHTPLRNNGDIDCVNADGERKFPKLDYSKGFPDWWYLSRTDIKVPSEHVQHGQRYAAEVTLAHFYEIDFYKNKLGHVTVFMQDYEGEPAWPYLDKLICQWRKVEEQKRAACGLDPAPVYKMCETFRGQERNEDDLHDEPTVTEVKFPTVTPLVAPDPIPIQNFGGDPDESKLPLGLCEGDCDLTTDCAPGLFCHRRDAFEAVPGCIGGEHDGTNTDYCIFDPYGDGYSGPTPQPSSAPTMTARPSVTPLPPMPLKDFGGDPPKDRFPLKLCQGDCDKDVDCAKGLICFQRDENTTVPGCIGGETDNKKTDYCILDPYGPGYVVEETGQPTPMPTEQPTITARPSLTPLPPMNLTDFGGDPPIDKFPLQLCEGDCDIDEHCARGLICFQRDENTTVPGCIGGETDNKKTDYCILDPYGPGYVAGETYEPTPLPSERPSLTPLIPVPLIDFGGDPPIDKFPLHLCEGDCDKDDHCAEGLICFQRDENTTVPGCIGGETDNKKTDYCILDPYGPGYDQPTPMPSTTPSSTPSDEPSPTPSAHPSLTPTDQPTPIHSTPPSLTPTDQHSSTPTDQPTIVLSARPSTTYTDQPTPMPSAFPAMVVVPSPPPTSFVKPTGHPKQISNLGWEPPTPLGECEGDCDVDSDCGPHMFCFQRNYPKAEVPGCSGGENDPTLTDYCTYGEPISSSPASSPSSSPTSNPTFVTNDPTYGPTPRPTPEASSTPTMFTLEPRFGPTSAPTPMYKPLMNLGWNPPPDARPLGQCEGDCDTDEDCDVGLICFQRSGPEQAVPFCSGGETDRTITDYCTVDATLRPSDSGTSSPTKFPEPTPEPSVAPVTTLAPSTPAPSTIEEGSLPPPINCDDYEANYFRMCKENSCCESTRSSGNFCHESYYILGDAVESACHHCCIEVNGFPKVAGPAHEENPIIGPNYFNCSALENSERMCKDNSCCDGSRSEWCESQFDLYPNEIENICYYCCYPSKVVDFDVRRALEEDILSNGSLGISGSRTSTTEIDASQDQVVESVPPKLAERDMSTLSRQEIKDLYSNEAREVSVNDRETHDVNGRPIIVREENFEPKGMEDEDEYFEKIHGEFKRRQLQEPSKVNYDDVYWWSYEWLLKVGTEYYFRYEGSQTVPPCYDTAHWRIFKDPIRVAPHQMRELERLIAWRLGNQCQVDTAGRPREGNPDAVDGNRPLQSFHKLHRKVFCECQDWPSKFPADRSWCKNWRTRDPEDRLFKNPYNWVNEGFGV